MRSAAAALGAAGLALAVYPVLRGSGSEEGLVGAALYARPAWLVAHCLGMFGFIATACGLQAVDRWAARLALIGTVAVLPYYGAEAFGLHALGRTALQQQDPGAIEAADAFRYQPVAMTIFGLGLLMWAASGVRLVVLSRRLRGIAARVGAIVAGVGLVGYLPQFFAPIEVRIGHGLLLCVGLLLLAASLVPQPPRAGAYTRIP
ncbi:hypothetical protein P0W64_08605 [Tsukamurella sp. 8F]|uniref:hypothetical protein n=1 Tax=unclassified Tsukamurella TaxID=2633480 RepID=UPI0023B9792E|nr:MULTISPECIES: hypothetical protein [unclassified Tsukamurella]MDF0530520.1 hypothetical protein [Tsukamurella sp. 8J]MDF0586830.1 hypothetical protein [Tsukamurella sp. 8F]